MIREDVFIATTILDRFWASFWNGGGLFSPQIQRQFSRKPQSLTGPVEIFA